MKVKALKDLNLAGRGIATEVVKKGEIFEISDSQPIGGKTWYYESKITKEKVPLVVGQDIEYLTDNSGTNTKPIYDSDIKKEKMGRVLFFGALIVLGYIVYKVSNNK